MASNRSLINTPCSVTTKGVPYLYLRTKAGKTGNPESVKWAISTFSTGIEIGNKKR